MSNPIYFTQECPTCGRQLQIRVEYLGKTVQCQHCRGQLEANDSASARCDPPEEGNSLLRRADELLESGARRRGQFRFPHPR
jgi:DNA-directed RNA polymerase subunit RPC12/RpoP